MPRRCLFGPVTPAFADQHLRRARELGECVTFGTAPGVDVVVQANDDWNTLAARVPAGWQPEFVALYLPYTVISDFMWSAPLPIVGLAADWNLLWHSYRRRLAGRGATEEQLTAIDRRAAAEVEDAVVFAEASPWPDPATVTDGVYAP